MKLSSKQKRHLRGLGHHLSPVVLLGKHGITDAVTNAADIALTTHELIKIKCGSECPDHHDEVAERLSKELQATLVGTVGRTILLYRRHPEKPQIELPRV